MTHRTLLLILCSFAAACTGTARDVTDTADECGPSIVEGQSLSCECEDGRSGVRECLNLGLLSACDCGDPDDDGATGASGGAGSGGEDTSGSGDSSDPDDAATGQAGDDSDAAPPESEDPFSDFFGMGGGDDGDPFGGMFGGGMDGMDDNPFGGMDDNPFGGMGDNPFGGFGMGGGDRVGTGDGEALDECGGDDGCSEGLLCYIAGGFCTPTCEDDGDCGELGGAEWTCGITGTCRVICEDASDCPGDQVCGEIPQGGGRCATESFGGL